MALNKEEQIMLSLTNKQTKKEERKKAKSRKLGCEIKEL